MILPLHLWRRGRRGSSPPGTPRRRRLPAAVASATALALLLTGTAASAHTTAATGPSGGPATAYGTVDGTTDPVELSARASGPATLDLTLVTGDRVSVALPADGRPVVRDIVPALRDDGRQVAFHTITRGDRAYVVPSDAAPMIAQDVLDLELFNLAALAEIAAAGTVDEVPVIVTHPRRLTARSAPPQVDGATMDRILPVIDATAQRIDGDGGWWRRVSQGPVGSGDVRAAAAGDPLGGIEKVWLNGMATLQLEDSVPQVGAPHAWAEGYDGTGVRVAVLDAGIDPEHPDVADRIIDMADFTGNPDGPRDGHGHGTHVAATIAGTGGASDGLRPGVAPGADLLIGKVCGDGGSCAFDAVIAGMEWAAMSGARVINMSIGAAPTDGTDPMSMAVDQLSQLTGALFVVAAGNSGPERETVAAPGAADFALTVAAVDDDGEMAPFSGRGPRTGDGAAKPDLAAPGVAIVAARAGGTEMGTVVDDHYTAASGTSMATPHVAGAAAIALQNNPELTGQQVKAQLMETAADLGHDEFAQGAGLVDIARSVDSELVSSGQVQFGRLTYPHQPHTRPLTYTNLGDQPVTLSLAADMVTAGGDPAPAGLLALDRTEITIPAGDSSTVEVTVDGRALGDDDRYGRYRGAVQASDSAGQLRSRVRLGAFIEPERHELTVEVVPPAGATEVTYGAAWVVPMDDQVHLHDQPAPIVAGPRYTAGLYAGSYTVTTHTTWQDAAGEEHVALLTEPDVVITDGPAQVRLDLGAARSAVPSVDAPETHTYAQRMTHRRVSQTRAWSVAGTLETSYDSAAGEPNWWTLPTSAPQVGTMEYHNLAVLIPPMATMRAVGGGGPPIDLQPRYGSADHAVFGYWQAAGDGASRQVTPEVYRFDDRGTVPVVDAGAGTPDELDAAPVQGAVALLRPSDICRTVCDYEPLRQLVEQVAARGAAGVLVAADTGRPVLGKPPENDSTTCGPTLDDCPDPAPYLALPVVTAPAGPAQALAERLQRGRPMRIQLGGEPQVRTVYGLAFIEDRVPRLPHELSHRDLARIDHEAHSRRPGLVPQLGFEWARSVPGVPLNSEPLIRLPGFAAPGEVTTLIGPRRDDAIERFRLGVIEYAGPFHVRRPEHLADLPVWAWPAETQDVAVGGDRAELVWNSGPPVPGAIAPTVAVSGHRLDWNWCVGCREGGTFWPLFYVTGNDGAQRSDMVGVHNDIGLGHLVFGGQGCEPPRCTIALYDGAGNPVEHKLVPISAATGGGAGAPDAGDPDAGTGR